MNFNGTNSLANIKPELITDKVKEVLNFEKETDKKAVVLSSGGLDSLVVLKYAIERFGKENVYTLDFSYGQNHTIEMSCSKRISEHFGIHREVMDISEIFKFSDSAMLKKNKDKIIHKSYEEQIFGEDGTGERHCVNTYCPNRNAILINIAGAYAISIGASYVLIGAHAEDAANNAYADTSIAFLEKEAAALAEGTDPTVNLLYPLGFLNKTENVTLGLALGLTEDEFALSFSCYDPIEIGAHAYKQCGTCATCISRLESLKANDIDPHEDQIYTEYKN